MEKLSQEVQISVIFHTFLSWLCVRRLYQQLIILIRFQNASGGFDKEAKNPNKSCLIELVKYQIDYNTERLFQKNGAKVEKQHENS